MSRQNMRIKETWKWFLETDGIFNAHLHCEVRICSLCSWTSLLSCTCIEYVSVLKTLVRFDECSLMTSDMQAQLQCWRANERTLKAQYHWCDANEPSGWTQAKLQTRASGELMNTLICIWNGSAWQSSFC